MEVCQNDDSAFLLMRFNQRDTSAFAMIYTKFFTELHVYANRLYTNTSESAEDAVQEAFCYLWERHDVIFDSLTKIKAFLFVAIKNRYKNHMSHLGVEQKRPLSLRTFWKASWQLPCWNTWSVSRTRRGR